MIYEMSAREIEVMLNSEILGRLGCCSSDNVYVVPINYAYDGKYIYAHSKEGMKIDMMRKNPKVCFEVDRLNEGGSWKSVILWGEFEELNTVRAQKAAMKIFTSQMARLIGNNDAMPSHGHVKGAAKHNDPFKSVVFRIAVSERSGRKQLK